MTLRIFASRQRHAKHSPTDANTRPTTLTPNQPTSDNDDNNTTNRATQHNQDYQTHQTGTGKCNIQTTMASEVLQYEDLQDDFILMINDNQSTTTNNRLSDKQEEILSLLLVLSGILSIVGSSTIVYKIAHKWNTKRKAKQIIATVLTPISSSTSSPSSLTPYDRLMLGLSVSDIWASMIYVMTPFLVPGHHDKSRVWARGNEISCNCLGFFQQLALIALWYNCMLSFYYLFTIRLAMKRTNFVRRIEPYMHISSIGYNVIAAIVGISIDVFDEMDIGFGCWVNEYPKDCMENENVECISLEVAYVFAAMPAIFAFLSILFNNLIIYLHVRHILGGGSGSRNSNKNGINHNNNNSTNNDPTMRRTHMDPPTTTTVPTATVPTTVDGISGLNAQQVIVIQNQILNERKRRKLQLEYQQQQDQIRQVFTQATLYVLSFIVTYTPASIIRGIEGYRVDEEVNEGNIYGILVAHSLLYPLQGFFNMCVYNRPIYIKLRSVYPDKSFVWALYQSCLQDPTKLDQQFQILRRKRKRTQYQQHRRISSIQRMIMNHTDVVAGEVDPAILAAECAAVAAAVYPPTTRLDVVVEGSREDAPSSDEKSSLEYLDDTAEDNHFFQDDDDISYSEIIQKLSEYSLMVVSSTNAGDADDVAVAVQNEETKHEVEGSGCSGRRRYYGGRGRRRTVSRSFLITI